MISLEFIRVTPEAFAWIKKNRARFETYLDGELNEADDKRLMTEIGLKHSHKEPFDVDDADYESSLAALGADGKLGKMITLSPAAVKKVTLPEVFAEHDIEKLFKAAAKRGDYMLVTSTPHVVEERAAPRQVAAPKDRAGLLALLASRESEKASPDDVRRFREEGLQLAGVALGGQKLKDLILWSCDLSKADLSSAKLVQCRLEGANLEDAKLQGATLDMASLDDAKLCRADLTNAIVKDCSLTGADLSAISAQGLKLSTYGGVQFRVKVGGADLRKARINVAIYDSDFRKANLAGAVLTESQLLGSDFSGCDLTGANFTNAGLQNANLTGAVLDKAKFTGATYTKKTKWPGDPPAGAVLVKK